MKKLFQGFVIAAILSLLVYQVIPAGAFQFPQPLVGQVMVDSELLGTTSVNGTPISACPAGTVTQVNGYSDSGSGMSSVVTSGTTTPVIDIQWINSAAVPISITGTAGGTSALTSTSSSSTSNLPIPVMSGVGAGATVYGNTNLGAILNTGTFTSKGYSDKQTISQTGVSVGVAPSGYLVGTTGSMYLGSEGAATTLTLSGGTYTSGTTGVTATCSTACFTSAVADVGRVLTLNNSGTLYTAAITAYTSTTVVTVTIGPTTVPGGNLAYTTGNWGEAWPLPPIYASKGLYLYYPSTVTGAAGFYWTVMGANATTYYGPTTGTIYNNQPSYPGDPVAPGSNTAWTGLTAASFVGVTTTVIPASISIPAGTLGINGLVEVMPTVFLSPSANNHQLGMQFGSNNTFFSQGLSANDWSWKAYGSFSNAGSLTSQIYTNPNTASGSGASTQNFNSALWTVNTGTTATNVQVTFLDTNANDWMILGSSVMWMQP